MQTKYLIGTLFQEEEQNKKMNINNVKAKDPMGNVRWKGAFTGGFEAGYKNTCGSKDGWAPATFVSSVGTRFERKEQNIFDFMDKEDIGRQAIGQNISMNANFLHQDSNPLNISVVQSAGQKLLNKMKKKQAYLNAPQNIEQLHKLLQNYEQQQKLTNQITSYTVKGVEGYKSVGVGQQIPNDDFIVSYEQLFRKVIRTSIKQQTEEEIKKRREENKIYFDFTRPIDEQPDYLRQIQDIQQAAKPKKRRKNIINSMKLKDLFKVATYQLKMSEQSDKAAKKLVEEVPADYDPHHRIHKMKEKQKQFIVSVEERKKHRVQNLNQRSDLLNEVRLSSKFVNPGQTFTSSKFVRAGQQQTSKGLQKVFEDEKKNKRYWDYVEQLEGRRISAQLQYLNYQEAEKQRMQFQKMYNIKNLAQKSGGGSSKSLPSKVEEAIKNKNRKQIKIIRKTGTWRPDKLLCKRFGCLIPYKQQAKTTNKPQSYFN